MISMDAAERRQPMTGTSGRIVRHSGAGRPRIRAFVQAGPGAPFNTY